MDLLQDKRLIKIRDINPHIVCGLCAGYFVDATTIAECLHTFCKSCIVKYLQTSKNCPACGKLIHETQPLSNIMLDRTIQELVEKIIPGLAETERKRQSDFYASAEHQLHRGDDGFNQEFVRCPILKTDFSQCRGGYRDDTQIPVKVELDKSQEDDEELELIRNKAYHVLCSCRLRVSNLEKLVHRLMAVPHHYKVKLLCNGDGLHEDSTLKYVYLCYWKQETLPMDITYQIMKD